MNEIFDIKQIGDYQFNAGQILSEIEEAAVKSGLDRFSNQLNIYHRIEETNIKQMLTSFVGSLHPGKNQTGVLVRLDAFSQIHPYLKGSYTEEVCNQIRQISEFPIGRIRLLGLNPKSCYSWHRDPDLIRYHIPLKTFHEAFFVVNEGVYRMPDAGKLYTIVSTEPHTAINAAFNRRRVHLVFDTYTQEQLENNPYDHQAENVEVRYDTDNIY
jgi:hypothetical protein